MLSHIIVPLDTSTLAESVLWRLGSLMAQPKTEVTLVHALEAPLSSRLDPGLDGAVENQERGYFGSLAKKLAERGVRCNAVVTEGRAADLILSVASDHPDGMIAMSTHGRTGLSRVIFGSVAESVLHRTPVPVLLLRAPVDSTDIPDRSVSDLRLKRVLVPLDGSPQALEIVPHVVELAKSLGLGVTLVHVLPGRSASAESMPKAERILTAAADRFQDSGIAPEKLVRSGDAAEEILGALGHCGADLIACTTHGHSAIASAVMGSIAEKLVRSSQTPLLVARCSDSRAG
ncbi:MAG: universal stress protein [Planctomycetes bacterium]|nr:universal stress protein [Planctomycetota bacterium]